MNEENKAIVVLNEQKRNIEDDMRKNDYLIFQYENRIKQIKDENITLEQKRQDFILLLNSVIEKIETL